MGQLTSTCTNAGFCSLIILISINIYCFATSHTDKNELLGYVATDDIHYTFIKFQQYQRIGLDVYSSIQLKLLFRYGSIPVPSCYDYFVVLERTGCIEDDYYCSSIDDVLSKLGGSPAAATTGILFMGVWGGQPIHSSRYFTGSRDYFLYDISFKKQEWPPPVPSILEIESFMVPTKICTEKTLRTFVNAGALQEVLLLPFSIDGLPEIVMIVLNVTVPAWVSHHKLQCCVSPNAISPLSLANSAKICTAGVWGTPFRSSSQPARTLVKGAFMLQLHRPLLAPGWSLNFTWVDEPPNRSFMLNFFACIKSMFCPKRFFGTTSPVLVQSSVYPDMLGSQDEDGKYLFCPNAEHLLTKEHKNELTLTGDVQFVYKTEDQEGIQVSYSPSTPISYFFSLEPLNLDLLGTLLIISVSVVGVAQKPLSYNMSLFSRNSPGTLENSVSVLYQKKGVIIPTQGVVLQTLTWEIKYPALPTESDVILHTEFAHFQSAPFSNIEANPTFNFTYCSESLCPAARGKCDIKQGIGGFSYAICLCKFGFGGEACEQIILTKHQLRTQLLSLELSNLAMLWPIWLTFKRTIYGLSLYLIFSMFCSSLYHLCDMQIYCALKLDDILWKSVDMFLSFTILLTTVCYLAYIPVQFQGFMASMCTLIALIIAIQGSANNAYIFIFAAIIWLVFALVEACARFNKYKIINNAAQQKRSVLLQVLLSLLSDWNFYYLAAATPCLAVAGFTFHSQSNATYWFWHSLWHIAAMFGIAFMIISRRIIKGQNEQGAADLNYLWSRLSADSSTQQSLDEGCPA